MNNEQLINKVVINKNNEQGKVISVNGPNITVKYDSEEKTYNFDIAFKNKFLSFLDEVVNQEIDNHLSNKESEEKKNEELVKKNDEIAKKRSNSINTLYEKLYYKNQIMKGLFGGDFIYPPYVEFVKKYKHLISVRTSPFDSYALKSRYQYN